jgi:CheY-like chemotaxis protein
LTFARKTDTAFESADVNVVVREVASMLRETLPKQIRVVTKLADEVPRIHADPNQLHQAILNLAVNARDAMPQGGVLTLGTDVVTGETLRGKFPEASGDRYVEMCVADNGEGMNGETRRRIFEPFFTTKGTKGQGLGLSVVYGIVNSHRGYVDVESEVGKGTTFRIYIEVPENGSQSAEAPPAGRRKSARRSTAQTRAAEPGRRSTILFVEDEETLLSPIREILTEEGFDVLTALDGTEAVRVHAENAEKIDVVLLDLGLPRLGGWEAFLKMRERDSSLRCIVASGNIEADQRTLMEEAGVQASVRKPYGVAEILRVLRQVLET